MRVPIISEDHSTYFGVYTKDPASLEMLVYTVDGKVLRHFGSHASGISRCLVYEPRRNMSLSKKSISVAGGAVSQRCDYLLQYWSLS